MNNASYTLAGAVEETSHAELRATFEPRFFGAQAGDRARAARAIVDAVEAGASTLRLPLGADAVQPIRGKIERLAADVDHNESVALATAFDGLGR